MLLNLLLDAASGGATTPEKEGNPWTTYIIFGVLLIAIVGMFIWQSISSKKKQKEAASMLDNLKKGDRVKTIGGVCGFVYEINNEENTFVLETGSEDKKSYVKFDKGAIYQTAPKEGSAVAAQNAENKEEEKKEEVAQEKPAKKSRKSKKAVEVKEEVVETPAEEVKEEVATEQVATEQTAE